MADRYKKPCLDSSIFIGGLNGEICSTVKRGVVFHHIWEKARAGEFTIFISAIALVEVYKKKHRQKSDAELLDEFLEYASEPFVEVIEVDRETGIHAHKLCREYAGHRLMPNDAIHLACALRAGCDVLLAWDTPLAGISHPDIRIEEPEIYDRTLLTETEVATLDEISAYEELRKAAKPEAAEVPGGGGGSAKGQTAAEGEGQGTDGQAGKEAATKEEVTEGQHKGQPLQADTKPTPRPKAESGKGRSWKF